MEDKLGQKLVPEEWGIAVTDLTLVFWGRIVEVFGTLGWEDH